MSVRTQGTELYFVDPDDNSVKEVGCVTVLNGLSASRDQIETTCLNSPGRTYEAGLATPGNKTFGLNTDPRDPSHVRLHQLFKLGVNLNWALGWSDGEGIAPGVDSNGDIEAPATRTWLVYEGYVSDFPFDFNGNDVVRSTLSVQVSGIPEWLVKTP